MNIVVVIVVDIVVNIVVDIMVDIVMLASGLPKISCLSNEITHCGTNGMNTEAPLSRP